MTDPTPIGPFDLETRLGEGGMGTVYRGEHRATGVPVAIKVIRREADADARRDFHREVQAHAGLQHPGVVYLFDYGEIDARAADASDGELRGGDPFVAMELADRGTLRDAMPPEDWETVCRLLVQILDALAYAHARGVVHRDLKPENLLLFDGGADPEPDRRLKLADFGIAHALQHERNADTDRLEGAAGTPFYMAPEQLHGRWRQYGPWTDLYAVGCIAWELVCGRPPFRGDSFVSIANTHQQAPRPPLEPQFPVPRRLESWIHRAMAVDPEHRFRRAADAAWALPRAVLAEVAEPSGETPGAASSPAPTDVETRVQTLASTVPLESRDDVEFAETVAAGQETGDAPEPDVSPPERILAHGQPPVPEDWRPERTDPLPAPLVGAGLGLFGLREPPFVNRSQECQQIWGALREVVEQQTTRMLSVRGDAGTGKSRLVEWMATRAHEVGAVQVLRAVHTDSGGPNEGLRGALERSLRTLKMPRGEVFEHLQETLPPLEASDRRREPREEKWHQRDARALTEYLRPTNDEADQVDGPRYRFSSADQKRGLLVRVLRRLANRRPVLLWLDDLQWGHEAIRVVDELLERRDESPAVLTVATVRSDILHERPNLAERIDRLEAADSATHLALEPLETDHQRDLLHGLLPLDDELAERLARRTEGHPLFAMQLLAHWIDDGVLEADADGFRLPPDRQVELPADIHELWMDRIERLVAQSPSATRHATLEALERAAALGREIDHDEWQKLCEPFDGLDPQLLRHRLLEAGLAERTDRGWAFAHGLLVDSLERRAHQSGRREEHHRTCAELLEDVYPDRPEATASRRADHRIAAGDFTQALEPLLQKARRLENWGEMQEARRALERRGDLLGRLDVAATDHRSIENDLELAHIHSVLGAAPESLQQRLEKLRGRAKRNGSERLMALAWLETCIWQRNAGQWDAAVEAARQATRLAEASDDLEVLVKALIQRGGVALHLGHLDEARDHFSAAHTRAAAAGRDFRAVHARHALGWVAMMRGNDERATALFEETLDDARKAGYRTVERCLTGLGEMARFRGDSERARERYRQSRALQREMNHPHGVALAVLNLAQVELMAARFSEAAALLEDADRRLTDLSRRTRHLHLLRLSRLAHAAGVGNWAEFDDLLSSYADGWPEDAKLVKDHPWLLEMAGDYAADADQPERAREAWRLARQLWDKLGDEAAAAEVDDKLDRRQI